jgi:hypothetical protein
MKLTDKQESIIEDILMQFNFHKVRRVMEFLEWTWCGNSESPSINELRNEARNYLEHAFNYLNTSSNQSYAMSSSGGFTAYAYENSASLAFNAEEVDAEYNDD